MGGNFGFVHEKINIKILILYVLRALHEPVTLDVLTDLVMCDDGICYFDFVECVAELLKTEHLRLVGNKYSLTAKGVHNGEIAEKGLPATMRSKAEKKTSATRSELSRDSMIKTFHTKNQDGSYTVALSLSDGVGDILSMALFAANEKQALDLERGFRKKAESIFNTLIVTLLE